jgi:hypothetical protein
MEGYKVGTLPRAIPATGTMKAIVAWWRFGQARLARWFSERLISPAAVFPETFLVTLTYALFGVTS